MNLIVYLQLVVAVLLFGIGVWSKNMREGASRDVDLRLGETEQDVRPPGSGRKEPTGSGVDQSSEEIGLNDRYDWLNDREGYLVPAPLGDILSRELGIAAGASHRLSDHLVYGMDLSRDEVAYIESALAEISQNLYAYEATVATVSAPSDGVVRIQFERDQGDWENIARGLEDRLKGLASSAAQRHLIEHLQDDPFFAARKRPSAIEIERLSEGRFRVSEAFADDSKNVYAGTRQLGMDDFESDPDMRHVKAIIGDEWP